MTTLSIPHLFKGFFQVAYVTSDLKAAMKIFADEYGVKNFFAPDEPFVHDVITAGRRVTHKLQLGLANIGESQIELIQPLSDGSGRYAEVLPAQGFAMKFHHLGCRFRERAQWDAFRANLDTEAHPIAFENADGVSSFLYTDERPRLGHYLEYMWLDEQASALFDQIVPQN